MATTWDASFETEPAGASAVSLGDNYIRTFKEAVRERIAIEHVLTTGTGTASLHGWQRLGSARPYFTQAKPTLLPDGVTALGTDAAKSLGRLLIKSNADNMICVWSGATWAGILKEVTRGSVQGNLAVMTNCLPPICFTRTVTVTRVMARVGTKSSTNAIILNLKKNGSASIFKSSGDRPSLATNAGYSLRTTGNMSASGIANLNPTSYLTLDIAQVGGTIKGSDLAVVVEVSMK